MTDFTTRHEPDRSRYAALLDDAPIGEAVYRDGDGERTFTHTVIEPGYEGNGYGTRLVRAALDDTRDAGLRPVGQCSMVRRFLERHPEYAAPVSR